MTLHIRLPYGCPQCQRSDESGTFPKIALVLDDAVADYSGTHYFKRGFVCPICGWGREQSRKIDVFSYDGNSVFFRESGCRPFYYFSECTTCGSELSHLHHECTADDYPDEYLLPGGCRACARSDSAKEAVQQEYGVWLRTNIQTAVSVKCPYATCAGNELMLIDPPPSPFYKEVECTGCGSRIAINSQGELLPYVGMEFEIKVWKAATGGLKLRDTKFGGFTHRLELDDMTTIQWHDRIRVRVTSVDHKTHWLRVQYIETIAAARD